MKQTRAITEGAILISLYAVLLLAALYLPIIGVFVFFALSLPFIVYTIRNGLKQSILLLVVSLFVTYMIGGILVLPLTFMFGSSGMIIGYLYTLKKPAFTVLIAGSLAFILNMVAFYGVASVFFNFNIAEQTQNMMEESFDMAKSFLNATGQEPSEELQSLYDQLEMIPLIVPSGLVLSGIMIAVISQFLASRVLKRLKISVATFPPFRKWKFPQSLLWYYLIVMVLFMVGMDEGTTLYVIVLNLFIVLEAVMAVQGFAFIAFYIHQKGLHKGIFITIVIISFLLSGLLYLVRILGIIDLGFDLRKKLSSDDKSDKSSKL